MDKLIPIDSDEQMRKAFGNAQFRLAIIRRLKRDLQFDATSVLVKLKDKLFTKRYQQTRSLGISRGGGDTNVRFLPCSAITMLL